jgi:signal transduction histidine kinase
MNTLPSDPVPGPPQPSNELPQAGVIAATETQHHPLTWRRLAVISVLFALFVFAISLVLDYILLANHDSPFSTIEISDVLAAVLAGVLFFKILQAQRKEQQHLMRRLEIISDMNHHIRNALQVIKLTAYSKQEQAKEVNRIDKAVERIQWALKEILPKI